MISPQISIFNYSIHNQANSAIDVYIDGEIVDASTKEFMSNFWGDETSVSYKSFRNQIEESNPKTLNVWINCPGGHVGDALAIHDYLIDLENKGVTVNRYGRGIIASAGTYLLMGKNSEMSKNSFMMIHNISMFAVGDINQLENQVKTGRKFNDKIRDFYASATGQAPETIAKWMNNETWMTADEAYDRKFVTNKPSPDANFSNSIPVEKWNYSNKAILNTYNSYTHSNNSEMDIKKITDAIAAEFKNILKALGLENKAEDPSVKKAGENFTTNLTNALKEGVPTDESITTIVNAAIGKIKFEELDSIKNLTTGFAKTEDITNAVKDFATKSELSTALNANKDAIIAAIADNKGVRSTGNEGGSGAGGNGKAKAVPRNLDPKKSRFAAVAANEEWQSN